MVNMIFLAATFAGLVSGAAITPNISNKLVARTLSADNPPCPYYFTPFVYKGCYIDTGPRMFPNPATAVDPSKMTPEYCHAACKGNFAP